MSGSPFDTLNRDVVNSSDYIRKLSDSTKWKTMQKNMAKGFGPNPLKRNGRRYQSDFFVDTRGSPKIDQSGCVVAARNYELLQSISRGKFYANPSLDGAAAAKFDMWFANCLSIEYQTDVDTTGIVSGLYIPPILMTNIYDSTAINNTPYFNQITGVPPALAIRGYDMIPFPATCLDDCSYNGLVPGFVEDPFNTLFLRKCIGAMAAVARPVQTNLSHTEGWLRELDHVKFRDTPYYWKGTLAQPLNKYSYPGRVPLYYQGPSESAIYRPLVLNKGSIPATPKNLLETYCSGAAAFN